LDGLPQVELLGADRRTRWEIAAAAARRAGLGLYAASAEDLPTEPAEREQLARLWQREAVLTPAALLVETGEAGPGPAPRAGRAAGRAERTAGGAGRTRGGVGHRAAARPGRAGAPARAGAGARGTAEPVDDRPGRRRGHRRAGTARPGGPVLTARARHPVRRRS